MQEVVAAAGKAKDQNPAPPKIMSEDYDTGEEEEEKLEPVIAKDVKSDPASAITAAPTAQELEDVARQQRREKKEAQEQMGALRQRVAQRLLEALENDEPGVFYLIAHHSTFVS